MKKIFYTISILALSLCSAFLLRAQVTGSYVPVYKQSQTNWCWATCTQMVYWAYGSGTISQCDAVTRSRDRENAWWAFGGCNNVSNSSSAPCSSPGTFNQPQSLYGCSGSISDILSTYNIASSAQGSAYSTSQLTTAMSNKQVIIARWGWNSGGGHVVVVNRYKSGNVYYNDPWYGSSYIKSYSSFKTASGSGNWTHTLRMNNSAPYGSTYYMPMAEEQELSLTAYPNPATDKITLDTRSEKAASVTIYNAVGQEVFQKEINGKLSIDVSTWAKGLYRAKITGTSVNRSFVIQ